MTESADSGEALVNPATKLVALDAAIVRGLDDAEAGRVKPSSEVFDRLEARLAGKADSTRALPPLRKPTEPERLDYLRGVAGRIRSHQPKMVPRKGLDRYRRKRLDLLFFVRPVGPCVPEWRTVFRAVEALS